MRLRKNMKRAAAAALALSVALSAAAPAALAKEYDISKGNITVTVKDNGDTYVLVGEAKDKDDIGEKDDTAVVIKGGENPDKTAGNNSDGLADEDTADETEGQKPVVDAEPGEPAEETGTELVVWPENVNSGEAQKKDGPEPAEEEQKTPDTPDTQKPEGKTDDDTLEASTEQKPVEKAAEDEDDDKDIMTFEANTASTVTKAVSKAMNRFIKIINNCTTEKDTTVTIENVNIYQYSYDRKAAMSVEGAGNTTLKLVGDNTLKGGDWAAGLEKDDEHSTGKLTITAEDASASLNAQGGEDGAGIGGGQGHSTSKLEIANGKIHAEGGIWSAGIGGGYNGNGEVTISGGEVTAEGGWHSAAGIGGSCDGSGKVTIKGGKVTAKAYGDAASIGGGRRGSGDVTILDGTVTATKRYDYYQVTGIGGGPDSTKKSTVRILGGVVDAVGGKYGSGIGRGRGDAPGAEVEIGGGAQVTAKGGKGGPYYGETYGAGAAIGTSGEKGGKAGKEQDVNAIGAGTVTRINSKLTTACEHKWTLVSSTPAAVGQLGEKEYECSCGSTRTEYEPALPAPAPVEEQNSRNAYAALAVEGAAYEMHQESARCIVTADSDTATLFGCLGNLAELKAQGADTLVFRTKSRETALDIDAMLSLGAEDTIFTLTHSGSSATLTVGGADHSELIH